jgi:hypothetical protein
MREKVKELDTCKKDLVVQQNRIVELDKLYREQVGKKNNFTFYLLSFRFFSF